MALKKQINFKGVPAEYWTIAGHDWRPQMGKTIIPMALYFNESIRDIDKAKEKNGLKNFDNALTFKDFSVDGEVKVIEAYPLLKQSKLEKIIITPQSPALYDDEGALIKEEQQEVFEMRETNILVNAEDC